MTVPLILSDTTEPSFLADGDGNTAGRESGMDERRGGGSGGGIMCVGSDERGVGRKKGSSGCTRR